MWNCLSREPGLRLRCRAGESECGVGGSEVLHRQGHGRKALWAKACIQKSGMEHVVSGVGKTPCVS